LQTRGITCAILESDVPGSPDGGKVFPIVDSFANELTTIVDAHTF